LRPRGGVSSIVVPARERRAAFLPSGNSAGPRELRESMHRPVSAIARRNMTEKVGVVGGGIMGSGIAEVAARAGFDVLLREVDDAAAESAWLRLATSLGRAVRAGKFSEDDREAALARLSFTTELADLADRDVVVEAVVEDETEKSTVFRTLGAIVSPDCLLASNTSSIPIMKLASVTTHPERVIGLHFFNPVPVLPLVEVVPSLLTAPETVRRAEDFAENGLGKHTVLCKDRAGFVVNALLIPFLLAAIRMVESGFASPEDVDTAMVAGCAHPMGPLALADLIGLDTTHAVACSMYAEFKEPLYAAPPLLLRMVEAGLLGRKSGRGFFEYAAPPVGATA
jgi:3-hydroxybutyryl-CoA dehydrogenase